MRPDEFERLSRLVHDECGISIPKAKLPLLEGRLHKRLRDLNMDSFHSYYNYVTSPQGIENELVQMINAVTTNKTDFFREPRHFDFLVNEALPDLARHGMGISSRLVVWSAGCSTGEEPYTIAMVLADYASTHQPYDYMVLGTDISTRVLDTARRAIYNEELVEPVPMEFRQRYLLRSRDRKNRLVRMAPEIRTMVRFRRLNFMDSDFGMREPVDVIFCRNVIIYFDRDTQRTLINRFCKHLRPEGYLFLGHSESIHNLDVPLHQIAPTVYRLRDA
jgi:chemotaxis protein methyltransferase CheR